MKSLAIAAALVALSTSAMAADCGTYICGMRPYVGVDLGQQSRDLKDQNIGPVSLSGNILGNDTALVGSPYVGLQINKYLAVEGGYSRSTTEDKNISLFGNDAKFSSRSHAYTLDALLSLPMTSDNKFNLLGDVGAARETTKTSTSGTGFMDGSNSNTDTTWRVGAGAQYALTDNVAGRVLVRYQGETAAANHGTTATVGVKYSF